jgi:hypothetical protein
MSTMAEAEQTMEGLIFTELPMLHDFFHHIICFIISSSMLPKND